MESITTVCATVDIEAGDEEEALNNAENLPWHYPIAWEIKDIPDSDCAHGFEVMEQTELALDDSNS